MEGDSPAQAKVKRKAEPASPTCEHHDQSTSNATDNDRKRFRVDVSYQSDPVTATSSHSLLAYLDEIDYANDISQHSHGDDENENDEDENNEDDNDDDENNEDGYDEDASQNPDSGGDEESDSDRMDEIYGIFSDGEKDTSPQAIEIEMHSHSIGESYKTVVVFEIYLREDNHKFEKWMQTIHVRCIYEGKDIGGGFGRYVRRDSIRSNFWRDMEAPCQGLSKVAFDIFDRYDCLGDDLKSHIVRKGSGVWGSELDLGSFFVIEELRCEKDWRGKGLGKQVATLLLIKAQAGNRDRLFILVNPGWLIRNIEEGINEKTQKERQEIRLHARNGAWAFYRSLGFRRIGASCCFGFATNADHPAHMLPSSADFDPLDEEADNNEPPEGHESTYEGIFGNPDESSWHLKLLEARLPLHYAAITLPDNECLEFFKEFKLSEKPIGDWAKVDRSLKNILHVAASAVKIQSVRWLLGNMDDDQKLSSARDVRGYTLLEVLESKLENKRTIAEHGMMTVVMSDEFRGHSPEAIGCLTALHNVTNPSAIQLLQLKYGCTCSECIDGFLSPRMRFTLLYQADEYYGQLKGTIEEKTSSGMSNDDMIDDDVTGCTCSFFANKFLRRGYSSVFYHTAITLRANMAPTIVNILNSWRSSNDCPPVTRKFYEGKGNAENALSVIFDCARKADKYAGNGKLMMVFKDDINALPKCRNDHEFGFVALACGL